jgi:putative adenylate-forming enzyme
LLAKAVEEGRLSIKPAKIISVAEVLTDEDKKYFEKVFKKKISQVYQCTEGFLGYTCECGSLHINEDVVYIEKEYLDKNRFVPIITDFIRKTQPIIRYRLNDILVEDKRPCKCGSKLLRLKKIEGRLDDVFLFDDKNGKEITVFPDFISRVVLYVPKIKDYKVTQIKKDEVVFALDNLEKSTQKKITAEFKALSKKMKFVMPKLKFESFIPDYSRKMKRIERKIK